MMQLFMSDTSCQETILSDEGCTQGDPAAMGFYALGVKPLIDKLHSCTNVKTCKQSWFADDSSAIGKLKEIRKWWQILHTEGPKYGYHPKPSKCNLIIKNADLLQEANRLFSGTGIKISYHIPG